MKGFLFGFFKKFFPLFFCFYIMFTPYCAYAFNSALLEDEVHWIDKGEEIYYNNAEYFEGFSKYIADENEGCFYLFTRFTDSRIDKNSKDNITLGITVRNDRNSYTFQMDKDGLIGSPAQSLDDIEVYCNFDEASCKRQGGGIFAAVKLKNKEDRKRTNYISCEYFCGLDLNYNLFTDIELDMFIPETAKNSTSKKIPVQSTTRHSSTQTESERDTAEQSTKFEGTGTRYNTARSGASTKFSGSQSVDVLSSTEEDAVDFNQNSFQSEASQTETSEASAGKTLSFYSKLLIVIFAVLFSIGIICVFIGVADRKRIQPENKAGMHHDASE